MSYMNKGINRVNIGIDVEYNCFFIVSYIYFKTCMVHIDNYILLSYITRGTSRITQQNYM